MANVDGILRQIGEGNAHVQRLDLEGLSERATQGLSADSIVGPLTTALEQMRRLGRQTLIGVTSVERNRSHVDTALTLYGGATEGSDDPSAEHLKDSTFGLGEFLRQAGSEIIALNEETGKIATDIETVLVGLTRYAAHYRQLRDHIEDAIAARDDTVRNATEFSIHVQAGGTSS